LFLSLFPLLLLFDSLDMIINLDLGVGVGCKVIGGL
jgi:hypothetical protein